MAGLIEDSQVEINGPLGNGFDLRSVKENIVIIAGGIGIAPLSMLTENLRRTHPSSTMIVYKGFQSASAVVGLDKCRNFAAISVFVPMMERLAKKVLLRRFFKRT